MGKTPNRADSATRQHLLHAALKCFARCGYAAASVQDIVDAAQVSKPALYYHFGDKAHLFQALMDHVHDERYRLMQTAAARGKTAGEKLEAILAAVFAFSVENRELMRLAFASAFAGPGEAPAGQSCREKGRRNFEFVRELIEAGQAAGELEPSFSADELAMGIYGQLNSYVMIRLLIPDCPLDQQTAKQIVRLFLQGAVRRNRALNGAKVRRPTAARPDRVRSTR
jgi:AcrR family transcriptional regulator